MLKYFSVENFKNFKDKIEMDFSVVRNYNFNTHCIKSNTVKNAIIYGKNSSGKSNLGYAIFDIMYNLVDKKINYSLYENYLNANSDKDFAYFTYVFLLDDDEVKYEYKKRSITEFAFEKLTINGELMFSYDFISHSGNFSGVKSRISDTLNLMDHFDLSIVRYIANNTIMDDSMPIKKLVRYVSNMVWFRSIGSNQYIGTELAERTITNYLLKNNLLKEFESFLNECGIDEKLISKKDPTGTDVIYFKKKKLLPFATAASSGTMALSMFYLWYNQLKTLSFVWIDEFDAFYHYELSESIVKMLEKQDYCQTVLSSHNTNLLSNSIMRPDTYFILSKGRLVSLCNATDRELREGHNLEKLYMNGEFEFEKNISHS